MPEKQRKITFTINHKHQCFPILSSSSYKILNTSFIFLKNVLLKYLTLRLSVPITEEDTAHGQLVKSLTVPRQIPGIDVADKKE